jgi:hypothetical protein
VKPSSTTYRFGIFFVLGNFLGELALMGSDAHRHPFKRGDSMNGAAD